jgi:hypothetical protein
MPLDRDGYRVSWKNLPMRQESVAHQPVAGPSGLPIAPLLSTTERM